jgi:tetratricopeptide (TPR) repeat protein
LAGWHGVCHYQHGTHLTLAFLVAIAGVAAHNLVDYNVQFVGILLPLTLITGIVSVPLSPRTTSARAKAQRVVEGVLAILVLAFALREGYYLLISSRGRHAEAQGKALQAIVWYTDAQPALFTRDLLLSKAALLLEPGKLDDAHLAEAKQALNDYQRVNAEDARLWKLRSDLAVAAQEPQKATDAYRKAYALGKYNDIGIAHLLLREMAGPKVRATPEIDAWRNELERVLNDFALAIEENAHFISLSRNVEGAMETASLLARLYPQDADAYKQLIERIRAKSQQDRTRFQARPDGLLWKAPPQ